MSSSICRHACGIAPGGVHLHRRHGGGRPKCCDGLHHHRPVAEASMCSCWGLLSSGWPMRRGNNVAVGERGRPLLGWILTGAQAECGGSGFFVSPRGSQLLEQVLACPLCAPVQSPASFGGWRFAPMSGAGRNRHYSVRALRPPAGDEWSGEIARPLRVPVLDELGMELVSRAPGSDGWYS
jgi:hypothetical protein